MTALKFTFFAAFLVVAPATGLAETYAIDQVHSSVVFRANHFGIADFYGRFNEISGTIVVDPKNPAKSSVTAVVKVASLDTHDEKRNGHLASPDFFNGRTFPVITFKSTAVKKLDDKRYEVAGKLTMHGVTKPLTLIMTHTGEGKGPYGKYRAGYAGNFTIKRSDFGMKFMLKGIGDEVGIILSLEAIRQ